MYIMVTRYEVLDNDIKKGGNEFPVALVRVGNFIQSNKDTYKRVYNKGGTYHYPQIPKNILRCTGHPYCRDLEMTRSK